MSGDDKRQLGRILLQRKLVPQPEVEAALREQKRSATPAPVAQPCVDETKDAEMEALCALADKHGVPGIDLTQVVIILEHLDVLPREAAEKLRILPVLVRDDRIYLAMADPQDKRAIDELEFVTGRKVYPCIAVYATLAQTIAAAYDAKSRAERHYVGPRVPAT